MTDAKESHKKQPRVMTNQVAIENDIAYLLSKHEVQGRGEAILHVRYIHIAKPNQSVGCQCERTAWMQLAIGS